MQSSQFYDCMLSQCQMIPSTFEPQLFTLNSSKRKRWELFGFLELFSNCTSNRYFLLYFYYSNQARRSLPIVPTRVSFKVLKGVVLESFGGPFEFKMPISYFKLCLLLNLMCSVFYLNTDMSGTLVKVRARSWKDPGFCGKEWEFNYHNAYFLHTEIVFFGGPYPHG